MINQATFDTLFDKLIEQARQEFTSFEVNVKNINSNPRKAELALIEEKNKLKYEVQWKLHFIGRQLVPENWENWAIPELFFQINDCMNVHEDYVNAGIMHPHHLVAVATGLSQRLNQMQLSFIFLRHDLNREMLEQIIIAQQKRGQSYRNILLATQMAEEFRK